MKKKSFYGKEILPDFVKHDYDNLVKFIDAFNEFLEDYAKDLTLLRDLSLLTDITSIWIIRETARYFPRAKVDHDRLIFTIRELYKRKGTIDAVSFLFRLFFNETIKIIEPNNFILRASDGAWKQRRFVTVKTDDIFDDDLRIRRFEVETLEGNKIYDIEEIIILDNERVRIYFRSIEKINFNIDDRVFFYDDQNDVVLTGKITISPSAINIIEGGKNWQVGQVFSIPGTVKDTIVKVTATNSDGKILSAVVYEYGYDHNPEQIVTVNPFPNRPYTQGYEYERNIISIDFSNPLDPQYEFEHIIRASDNVEEIKESIAIYSDAKTINSYFLENYLLEDFYLVFANEYTQGMSMAGLQLVDPNLTFGEWLASQTVVSFKPNTYATEFGYFARDNGQLSNPVICLQDNYYYQLFSYVVESGISIDRYRKVLDLIHPAGLKYFAHLKKEQLIVFDDYINVYKTLSKERIYLFEYVNSSADFIYKNLEKSISSQIDSDNIVDLLIKFFSKLGSDAFDLSDEYSLEVDKKENDSLIVDETYFYNFDKILNLSFDTTDTNFFSFSTISDETIDFSDDYLISFESLVNEDVNFFESHSLDFETIFYESISSNDALVNLTNEKLFQDEIQNNDIVSSITNLAVSKTLDDDATISGLIDSLTINKQLSDSSSLDYNQTVNITVNGYVESNYFQEDYISQDIEISIT